MAIRSSRATSLRRRWSFRSKILSHAETRRRREGDNGTRRDVQRIPLRALRLCVRSLPEGFVMRIVLSLLVLGVAFLSGCASTGASSVADGKPHGECLVCKHNADLACVDIPIDDSTPRRVYNGQTYYFCSDDCAKAFDKDPAAY